MKARDQRKYREGHPLQAEMSRLRSGDDLTNNDNKGQDV